MQKTTSYTIEYDPLLHVIYQNCVKPTFLCNIPKIKHFDATKFEKVNIKLQRKYSNLQIYLSRDAPEYIVYKIYLTRDVTKYIV